jgi:hypothetical protein
MQPIVHVNTPASKNYSHRRCYAAGQTPDGIGHATAGVVHSHPAVCGDASQHRVGGRAGVDQSLLQVGSQGAVGSNWLSHPSILCTATDLAAQCCSLAGDNQS